jgi:hypothetical protein
MEEGEGCVGFGLLRKQGTAIMHQRSDVAFLQTRVGINVEELLPLITKASLDSCLAIFHCKEASPGGFNFS